MKFCRMYIRGMVITTLIQWALNLTKEDEKGRIELALALIAICERELSYLEMEVI